MSNVSNIRDVIDVAEHDVVENNRSELMLVLDGQEEPPGTTPRLQLSGSRNEAILNRGSGQLMRISKINPEAMKRLREQEEIMVAELPKASKKGGQQDVLHAYGALIAQD